MIFSSPSEYAIRALSELVLLTSDPSVAGSGGERGSGRKGGYVMIDKVAAEAALPRDFLAKIFRRLTEAGILLSAKGPGGGFALARAAYDVSLLQIIEAIEGAHRLDRCVVGLARCNDAMPCPQHDLFKPIRQRLRAYMGGTTLADTAASLREKKSLSPPDTRIEGSSEGV